MVPQTVRFRHVLLILLLILLPAALPIFASAAEIGAISASSDHVDEGDYIILNTNMAGIVTWRVVSIKRQYSHKSSHLSRLPQNDSGYGTGNG